MTPKEKAKWWRPSSRQALAVAPVLGLVLLVVGFAPRGFFSGDSGVKFAQAYALWDSGFSTRALPNDDSSDPCSHYFAYGRFVRKVDGERQGIYSVVFAAVSAPFIGLFGLSGVLVVPLLGGILIAFAVRRLLIRSGCREPTTTAGVVVVLFLTPVGFYSSQLAEHTLAAGLVALALSFVVPTATRLGPLWAGLCIGAAASVRPEAYCAAASVGVALAVQPLDSIRRRCVECALYLAGALAILGAYWGLNELLSGTWDPLVVANEDRESSWENARTLLFGELDTEYVFRWFVPLLAAVALSLVPVPRRWHDLGMSLRAAAALLLLYYTWRAGTLDEGRTAMGLVSVTPIAAYGVLAGPWSAKTRALWVFALSFVVLVLAYDTSGTSGGLQFGARLLIPAVPILVVLAAVMIESDWRGARHALARIALVPALVLVILSGYRAIDGLSKPLEIARDSEVAARRAAKIPGEVVVTRRSWESQILAPVLLHGKRLYNVHGDPSRLLHCLADQGVSSFVLVARDDAKVKVHGHYTAVTVNKWKGALDMRQMSFRLRD